MNKIEKYYINGGIPKGIRAILSHRVLLRLAGAFTTLYIPIFLFLKSGQSVITVLIFFGSVSLAYTLVLPMVDVILSRFSMRSAMIIAMVFNILYYLTFFLFSNSFSTMIILAGIILVAFRMFYWIPYHVEVAEITEKKKRGRAVAIIQSGIKMIDVFLPVVGAAVIDRLSYEWMFVFTCIFVFVAVFPLFNLPKVKERFEFPYLATWKEFLNKKNRKMLSSYFADGCQTFVGVYVWPIFIYQVLSGNVIDVGLLSAGVVLVTIVLQLIIGKYIDQKQSRKIFAIGKWMFITGWAFKALIQSAATIFLAGAYHSFSSVILRTSYDAKMYDSAADQGHYVDEYTVLREMAINLGRVFATIISIILIYYISLSAAFIFAAFASILLALDVGYTSDRVQNKEKKNKQGLNI